MAKNLMASYMDWSNPDVKRSNWKADHRNITSADVGYGIPVMTDEIVGNTNVSLDFVCGVFTNPTKAPLYSRFKMQVTAWWCPTSCYVPALKDGAKVTPDTDYAFPMVNFDYANLKQSIYDRINAFKMVATDPTSSLTERSDAILGIAQIAQGDGTPYVPMGSIYSYLRMWPANFSPLQFMNINSASEDTIPSGKNAIPLLMYYDIWRHYIMNNQELYAPLRVRAFRPEHAIGTYHLESTPEIVPASYPVDLSVSREQLDVMFSSVSWRMQTVGSGVGIGVNYPKDKGVDITDILGKVLGNSDGLAYQTPFPAKYLKVSPSFIFGESFKNYKSEDYVFLNDYHYGLWRTTYLNDYYNAFISNENVEYERSTARIEVGDDGMFTLEQIKAGTALQNFVRKHLFRNDAFDEYVDVEYGCKPSRLLNKPLFLGSTSTYLAFNDVIAQSQSGEDGDILDNTSLGSRAAVGKGFIRTGKYVSKKERAFVKFHAPEPGYLMLILTVVPEVSYFEGYDEMYDKHTLFDLYRPTFDGIGYRDKEYAHINSIPSNGLDATGAIVTQPTMATGIDNLTFNTWPYETFNYAYAQVPYGFEHMGKPNIITGQMSGIGTYRHWTNARNMNEFTDQSMPFGMKPTTYVLPEMYNYIFANTQNLDNYQFFFDFDYNKYQPLSHRVLSWK